MEGHRINASESTLDYLIASGEKALRDSRLKVVSLEFCNMYVAQASGGVRGVRGAQKTKNKKHSWAWYNSEATLRQISIESLCILNKDYSGGWCSNKYIIVDTLMIARSK